jgi:hypothetical protein
MTTVTAQAKAASSSSTSKPSCKPKPKPAPATKVAAALPIPKRLVGNAVYDLSKNPKKGNDVALWSGASAQYVGTGR